MRVEISKLTKWALFMVFAMGVALPAFAENNTTLSLATGMPQDDGSEQNKQSLFTSFSLYRNTSLYDHEDGTRRDSMDYVLKLSLRINKDYGLSVSGGYSQDLNDSTSNDFGDTSLSLTKSPINLGSYVQMSNSVSFIAPTSKMSHTVQNSEGAARLGANFSMNPVLNPNLVLAVSLSGGQNFQQYDTDINGNVLNKYVLSQTFVAGYNIGNFSLSGIFTHINAWSYQSNMKEAFEHYEELGYGVNNNFALAVGHTNSGSVLKANGSDSNIAFINENTSMVYGSLTVMY